MKNLPIIILGICLFAVEPIAAQLADVSIIRKTEYSGNTKSRIDKNQFISSKYNINNFIPFSNSVRYNRVDGLFIGIGTDLSNRSFGSFRVEGLTINGQFGYSTNLKKWQYRAGGYKSLGRSIKVGAQIINVSTTDDGWRTNQVENSITSFVTGYDYHDYYKAEGYQFYTHLSVGRFIELSGSYNATTFSSLTANADYSIFKGGNMARTNPLIDSSTDRLFQENFGVNLALNNKLQSRKYISSKLELKTELADVGKLNNDFRYNKYQLISTNYIRVDNNTRLKLRFMGGSITGEAPDFKQFALGGIGTMRAIGYKFYSGNKMVLNNAELVFGNVGNLKFRELEADGLRVSVFLDSGWATNSISTNKDPFSGFDTFSMKELSHSVGAGLGLGMLRFELAKPLSGSQGFTSFWVRLNPTF